MSISQILQTFHWRYFAVDMPSFAFSCVRSYALCANFISMFWTVGDSKGECIGLLLNAKNLRYQGTAIVSDSLFPLSNTHAGNCYRNHRNVLRKQQAVSISRILKNPFAVMQAPSHNGA